MQPTNPESAPLTREEIAPGWYWVRVYPGGIYRAAEWLPNDEFFNVGSALFGPKAVVEIGPRIPSPEEIRQQNAILDALAKTHTLKCSSRQGKWDRVKYVFPECDCIARQARELREEAGDGE